MSPNQSRIAATFAKLNAEGRKALIPLSLRAIHLLPSRLR